MSDQQASQGAEKAQNLITPGGNPVCPKCGHWYILGERHECSAQQAEKDRKCLLCGGLMGDPDEGLCSGLSCAAEPDWLGYNW